MSKVKREKIIDLAHQWVATPYKHQARLQGIGVDCAQLVAGIALEAGFITQEQADNLPPYTRDWHLHNRDERLLEILESVGCKRVNIVDRKPGDILGFQYGRVTSHLGILVDDNKFIHARVDAGKVVVNTLADVMRARLSVVYRFPGVIR